MTTPDRETIRFNALRNALYHTARRRSLERWNRLAAFLVISLGASATGNLLGRFDIAVEWVAAAIALVGTLQLVLDFGRQARDHQGLQRDYWHLLADIEAEPEPEPPTLAAWQSRLVRISADEPPILRAVDARAYNDAVDAMEMPGEERLRIPLHHRLLGGVLPFDGHRYRKVGEGRAA